MIAYLDGKLAQIEPSMAIVDVGGVGYAVRISLQTYTQVKDLQRVKLFTHFQVREDAHVLFGFFEVSERELFELLISVSGVGGNTALMILSSMSPGELASVFQKQDVNALKRVKGIGAKTAERLVLELKDKIAPGMATTGQPKGKGEVVRDEALAALLQLGMPKPAMVTRLEKIFQEHGDSLSVAEVIKLALRNP
jgi:Holliday junction DNA helicase RuvA